MAAHKATCIVSAHLAAHLTSSRRGQIEITQANIDNPLISCEQFITALSADATWSSGWLNAAPRHSFVSRANEPVLQVQA